MVSRRAMLKKLFGTGVVAGIALLPGSALADDASSGDAGIGDAGSMDAGSTDAGTTPQDNPNTLTTDVAEIEFDLRGGPESDFWLYFRNGGGVVSGDLIGVPTNFPQPAGYMMVDDGNGGTVHFFEWLKAKGIGVLQVVTDIDTNNHDIGHKAALTGDPNGMRSSIPVERAYTYGGGSSFAYLADNGVGMPFTGGLPVGAGSLDVTTLLKLAQPYGTNSKNFIFPPDLVTFIQDAHKKEIDAALASTTRHYLPSFKRYLQGEEAARGASQQVVDFAKKILDGSKNPGNDKLANAADIFLQLFQAKQAYGVSLTTGGWDTHGDMNGTQSMTRYQGVMNSVVKIVNRAEELGVKARLVFKGDFNRTGLGTDSSHHKFAAPVIMGMPGTMGSLDGQHRRIGQFDGNKVLTKDQYSTMGDVHAFQQQLPGNKLLDISFNGVDLMLPPSSLTDGVPDRIQKLLDLG